MDIITEHADGVLCITINRPARKNAMTAAMYQDMADAFFDAEKDPAVRVVLIRAVRRYVQRGQRSRRLHEGAAREPGRARVPVSAPHQHRAETGCGGGDGRGCGGRHDNAAALRSGLRGVDSEILRCRSCSSGCVRRRRRACCCRALRVISGRLKSCCSAKRSMRTKRRTWAS